MRSCIKCNQQIGSCTSHFVAHCSVCPGMQCHQDEIQCCFCDFSAEREALRRHLWEHEALSQITCIYCEQNVPYQMNILLEHCRTLCPCMSHNDETHTYVCFGCAYHTYWTTNMRRHIKLKHRPEVHTFEKTFHCEYCRFRTEKQKLMDLHKAKRHGHNMIDVAKLKDVVVLDATDNVRKRREFILIEDILGDISGNDLSGKAETPLSNKHESCQKELSQIKELLTNLFHKMDTGNINKTFTVMELMPKDDVTMELKSHNIVFPLETPNDLQNLEHQMKTNSRVSALVFTKFKSLRNKYMRSTCINILRSTVSNKLAVQLCWSGTLDGKIALKDHKSFCDTLVESCRFDNEPFKDIIEIVKNWFKNAKKRYSYVKSS